MDFNEFKKSVEDFQKLGTLQKMNIAMKTDFHNNKGVAYFNQNDINSAINSFKEALKIMPANDDALLNLSRCYTSSYDYDGAYEYLKRLVYLDNSNKDKAIAHCLLNLLIEDFDEDGGAVYSSSLKEFVSDKLDIDTTNNEVGKIIENINKPYDRDILTYKMGGGMFGLSTEIMFLTTNGVTKTVLNNEIKDVLNWD